jgi:hypothetical protein
MEIAMTITKNEAEQAIAVIEKRFHLMQVKFNGGLTDREELELTECQTFIASLAPELRSAAANEVEKRRENR